jgi:hypothetical protein
MTTMAFHSQVPAESGTGGAQGRATIHSVAETRASYARVASQMQFIVTWFCGKPLPAQSAPRLMLSPMPHFVVTVLQLPAAMAATWLVVTHPVPFIVALPVTWLLTVNALRKLQVAHCHYAVHRAMSKSHRLNRAIHVVSSVLSLVQHFEAYWADHVRDHHSPKVFTTSVDPDAAFLLLLGFRPGMSLGELRRHLHRTLISPRFHFLFAKARFTTNFTDAPWPRRLLAVGWVTVLATVGVFVPWWAYLALMTPMLPLYHVSALLQFLSEHLWLLSGDEPPIDSEDYARRNLGRFPLELLPDRGLGGGAALRAWGRWFSRTLLIQLPTRFGVLVADLPAHDYHHLFEKEQRQAWTKSFYGRQHQIDSEMSRGMDTREFSSLTEAIDEVFRGLSEAPLLARNPSHLAANSDT